MNDRASLHRLLGAIVMANLASACGGSVGEGNPSVGQPAELACDSQGAPSYTQRLQPAAPVDYFARYRAEWGSTPVVVEAEGEACSGANNERNCLDDLGAQFPEFGFGGGGRPDYEFFGFTRGNEVGVIKTREELTAFLGTIDTPNEAALLLWAHGRPTTCDGLTESDGTYHTEGVWTVSDCPFTDQELSVSVAPDGTVEETELGEPEELGGCAGRRPDGLETSRGCSQNSRLGAYFAHISHLEGAAVVAFAILECELRAHGAPEDLIDRIVQARADEIRHARDTERLANKFGEKAPKVEVKPHAVRSLFDIAIENAAEGCVRETYGALSAHWQAANAGDAEVRELWRAIAREETQHAELSQAIDEWILQRLTSAERARVEIARQRAIADLKRELENEPDPSLVDVAGLPTAARAQALLGSLERELWAA